MRRPVQPITLLAARAPCTAACRPRPWCCSSWQPHRTAVRLCSVQDRYSAKNSSKYIESRTTLIARGCSPLEKGVRHHSAGMLFPRLSLHANTRVRPNGTWGKLKLGRFEEFEGEKWIKTRARSARMLITTAQARPFHALGRV